MSTEREKRDVSHEEDHTTEGSIILQAEARQAAERRLVRKLDFRLLPMAAVIFVMNYIDTAAIASARIQGLQTDLRLSDVQYDTLVAILFASYAPAETLSNLIINYISRPSLYVGTCVFAWGLIAILTGITRNFPGILACRILIGVPEAVGYPGTMYLLSSWYTRKELALRSAIFYCGFLFSNAFGSLWAAGIFQTMNGARGIPAWKWLFYIEGAITCAVGLSAMWLLPDHPANTRWLSPAERHLAQVRLAEDAGEADQDAKQASFIEGLTLALKDPIVLNFTLMMYFQAVGLSFIYFFPTLTATLGYSTMDTLLIATPPWVFASIVNLILGRHADATGERFFHQSGCWWVAMVGCIISLSTMNTAGRYVSMFLMTIACCGFSMGIVWVANSVPRPPAKRSAAIGLAVASASIGSLTGSYTWKSNWGPKYHQSLIIVLIAYVMATVISFVIRVMLLRENKRIEREELDLMHGPERERIEEAARLEGITFDEAVRRRRGFRYLY